MVVMSRTENQLTVIVKAADKEAIQRIAEAEAMSVSTWIRRVILRAMKEQNGNVASEKPDRDK